MVATERRRGEGCASLISYGATIQVPTGTDAPQTI